MADGRQTVLLVGLDDAMARRVVAELSSLGLHFDRVPWAVVLAEPAWALDAEVVVARYQGDRSNLEWLEALEGWSADGARGGAVVVVCSAELASEVEPLLVGGNRRLVILNDLDRRLRDVVSSLLTVAPRLRIRARIRLVPGVPEGGDAALGTIENLSSSGMLVSCPPGLPVGSTIRFEIAIPGQVEPIRGTARVVRMTDPERERVQGVGARFLSFLPSDRTRFDGLLSTQLH